MQHIQAVVPTWSGGNTLSVALNTQNTSLVTFVFNATVFLYTF